MTRGTSPALIINVTGNDFSDAASVIVSLEQLDVTINKTGASVDIVSGADDDAVITVYYTQKETLSLAPGKAYIQIRWTDTGGVAYASPIKEVSIGDVLMEGVI